MAFTACKKQSCLIGEAVADQMHAIKVVYYDLIMAAMERLIF